MFNVGNIFHCILRHYFAALNFINHLNAEKPNISLGMRVNLYQIFHSKLVFRPWPIWLFERWFSIHIFMSNEYFSGFYFYTYKYTGYLRQLSVLFWLNGYRISLSPFELIFELRAVMSCVFELYRCYQSNLLSSSFLGWHSRVTIS